MKPVHVIALVARLFAIALFLVAVRDLSAAIWVADDPTATHKLIPLYAASIASLVVAAMLWIFPFSIANKIYPVKNEEQSHRSLSSNELYSLGFIILGLYLLFFVLSDAIFWLLLVVMGARETPGYPIMTLENKAQMITTAIEFVIAMFLILGSNGVVSLVRKFRQQ